MNDSAVVTFTARGKDRLVREGGSRSWVLNSKRVRNTKYLVCVQNRDEADNHGNDWGEVSAEHKHAFLVGKIADVVLVREQKMDSNGKLKPKRWLIQISEYAEVDYPDKWDGARNPVAYSSLTELGIDEEELKFLPMPEAEYETYCEEEIESESDSSDTQDEGITIKEAKRLLATKYDVSSDDIEIVIRA